ncbi:MULTISPECIES: hypothetical protein [unclassified Tolypothrix]|uniref:hypothetical protein n=1 Tax=unclassified Tolypothrix TaxID=2649714 RepID=UPI0005EAA431|nr:MULTISPECIES: hypothetical protein [unclassified Tolypothrix]BAY91782.1 hypothetical protein NIES3275_38090 [Microchaete diplosiphon NIES-3275]EKF05073.1 hypothetical protein FDUTEX481_01241 [Tolypothrix sp. PCC 7601]MBE9083602.1 hypothetical protein [Tolypothrix sp. LEGE 11397]UYD25794.1 hypothetical protein HGR01_31415 [Tolypothrix sp. PCC 7712]UYD31966.1 hypothetical protein HG267_23115 [Tolypothrix sp. PCC 7601]
MEFIVQISNSIFTVLQNGDWGLVIGDKGDEGDEEAGEKFPLPITHYQTPNHKKSHLLCGGMSIENL